MDKWDGEKEKVENLKDPNADQSNKMT